jgi:ubiquitin C-terminal hydrolase
LLDDFEREIEMTGNNKFYCTNCNKERNAKTKTMLYKLPKYLIIHPARTNTGIRFSIDIKIDEILNLENYIHQKFLQKNRVKYRLIGIISHFGSSGFGGHNIFFAYRNNKWHEFNDSIVSDIDFEEIDGSTILILLYTIL